MTLFQLVLLIAAGVIFYLFFRQLFSGDYPRRGVDYEAGLPEGRAGRLEASERSFARAESPKGRVRQLLEIADESLERGDALEAKKALQSALVLEEKNPEILRRLGVAHIRMNNYVDAREVYEMLLQVDPADDLAHGSLANVLHQLGENDEAIRHHEEAIRIDPEYAPHYYNYANTLYDLDRKEEAREYYRKALELDPGLEEARKMLEESER